MSLSHLSFNKNDYLSKHIDRSTPYKDGQDIAFH
jgi:hypothetical protein